MRISGILFLAGALTGWAAEPALTFSMLDKDILCIRASQVTESFPAQVQTATPTNPVSGMVLDLRFADGEKGISTGKLFSAKSAPLIVLVNARTQGGAAELAGRLQTEGRAILIGIAAPSAPFHPDISVATQIEDEVAYQANPFEPATTNPAPATLNHRLLPFVDHTSEAELVRRRVKDGDDNAAETPRSAPPKPVIHDPALARAVDLLQALAVLPKYRS
jgi:hypothetical protein